MGQDPGPDPLIGTLVSERYRIIRKLGEGGMGAVYEALHEAIEKKIALKVLHAEYSSSPEVLERFKQEAISASRIKHQNVIDVFDFGQVDGGACFIAMEFLDGMDLGDALQKRGAFTTSDSIRIIVQVCRALGLAHGRGVIHRDLKPENVFLQKTPEGDEVVKIVDFGIAQLKKSEDQQGGGQERKRRLTKTGMIFGTPEYMAPEQARGQEIDPRSDIYAVGIILYELLTGAVPFFGDSFLEVLNKHTMAKVPSFEEVNDRVQLSPELQRAVYKALEKDPDDRYPTMKEFSNALLRTPEGHAVRTHISSLTGPEEAPDDPMRIENQEIPETNRGDGTAVFGSAGSPGTPMATEADAVEEQSNSGLYWGVATAVLAVVGGAGLYFLAQEPPKKAKAEQPAPVETAPAETTSPTPEPEPEPEKDEKSEAGSETAPAAEKVVLSIKTDPEGAIVKKDGFQVCEKTPCELSVKPGDAVTLTAELGNKKGEAKVLAQKDQGVTIALKGPARPRPRPTAPKPKPSGPAMCEVMVDGLKILRPCQ